MTAILAVRVGRKILIGSDRAWSSTDTLWVCGESKVTRVGGWLLGIAGHVDADWSSLKHFPEDPSPQEVGELLGNTSEAHAVLARGGDLRFGQCGGRGWGWGAVRGDIAIGSGAGLAQGAWAALAGHEKDPRKRLRAALRVAAKHCPSVCGPFDVVST